MSPTPDQIQQTLSYALIPIDSVQPYHVTGELDLLEAYETFRHRDAILYILQRNCPVCHQVYIEALKVASDESPIANWLCTRRNPRSNPWIQLLVDGKFFNYEFGENHDAYLKAKRNEIEPEMESKKEIFTAQWMNENPTKIVDGKPVEWPMRPNKKAVYEQLEQIQERMSRVDDAIKQKMRGEKSDEKRSESDGNNRNNGSDKKGGFVGQFIRKILNK